MDILFITIYKDICLCSLPFGQRDRLIYQRLSSSRKGPQVKRISSIILPWLQNLLLLMAESFFFFFLIFID